MARKRGPSGGDGGRNRPPRATQFKPGQSGNPRGRPPRTIKSKRELYREKGDELVTVNVGGRQRRMRRIELVVDLNFRAAMKGEWRARQDVLQNYPFEEDDIAANPYYVPAPDGRGSRLVTFELTEEELPLIEGIKDTLAKYKDQEGAEEEDDVLSLEFDDQADDVTDAEE